MLLPEIVITGKMLKHFNCTPTKDEEEKLGQCFQKGGLGIYEIFFSLKIRRFS